MIWPDSALFESMTYGIEYGGIAATRFVVVESKAMTKKMWKSCIFLVSQVYVLEKSNELYVENIKSVGDKL